jgi:tetratricopeptide (TPR) repeat protein
MARAAAKRNRGTSKAARPVTTEKVKKRKAEKSLEDELFFNRLRGHAKWVFVLLAVVFGASFVFLGVGSGNAGLSDVFSNVFGGSSGPSIESLQKSVAERPRDLTAVTDLAQALERDGRVDEAIATYQAYLQVRPKSRDALNNLALLYQNKAAAAAADVNNAIQAADALAPSTQFRPGTGTLGQALGSYVDPISQAATSRAQAAYQDALGRYQSANREALGVYKQLADLDPNEPTALLNYAQIAEGAGELKTAIAAYTTFLKRFPDDNLAADAKKKIADLKKQQAVQAAGVQLPGVGTP